MYDDRDHLVGSVPWVALGRALACHPALWVTAATQMLRLAPRRWWAQPPFLPLPDRAYLEFRVRTQYGGSAADSTALDPADVIEYLAWCRDVA